MTYLSIGRCSLIVLPRTLKVYTMSWDLRNSVTFPLYGGSCFLCPFFPQTRQTNTDTNNTSNSFILNELRNSLQKWYILDYKCSFIRWVNRVTFWVRMCISPKRRKVGLKVKCFHEFMRRCWIWPTLMFNNLFSIVMLNPEVVFLL